MNKRHIPWDMKLMSKDELNDWLDEAYQQGREDAIEEYASMLADKLTDNAFIAEIDAVRGIELCTLDYIVETIFKLAEQMKKNDGRKETKTANAE